MITRFKVSVEYSMTQSSLIRVSLFTWSLILNIIWNKDSVKNQLNSMNSVEIPIFFLPNHNKKHNTTTKTKNLWKKIVILFKIKNKKKSFSQPKMRTTKQSLWKVFRSLRCIRKGGWKYVMTKLIMDWLHCLLVNVVAMVTGERY